ncbi:MAG: nuclear transport factor 2 family protein [Conexibacter sp.]|nr:nuclear transport factor 2 family protein [Conexibacter sp.]
MARRTTFALTAVLALALAGCGADEEGGGGGGGVPADQQVRAVVARFGVATRDKDYQQICDQLLADELVAKIEAIGLPCESALQRGLSDVRSPTLSIEEVSISGTRALVSIHTTAAGQKPSNDALQVVREGGQWKIASLAAPNDQRVPTPTVPTTTTPRPATKTTDNGK